MKNWRSLKNDTSSRKCYQDLLLDVIASAAKQSDALRDRRVTKFLAMTDNFIMKGEIR